MNLWTQSKDNIFVAGHRGFASKYPENTMIGFKKAVEVGVDQIELDIRMTKDGELVIHHDYEADRTTTGHGHIRDMTLSEVLKLDAGIKFDKEFEGEKVPTLIEFLEFVKPLKNLTIDFELKEYPMQGRDKFAYEACDKSLELIDSYALTDRCVINTFSALLHEYIRKNYGNKFKQHMYYPYTLHNSLYGKATSDPYDYAYCCCVSSAYFSNPPGIPSKWECDYLRSKGIQCWGGANIDTEETVDMAIDRELVLITSNNPEETLSLLKKKGKHK